MTKSQLKKEFQTLTKEQLIEQILGFYDAYKPVKEYLKTFLMFRHKSIVVHRQFLLKKCLLLHIYTVDNRNIFL